MVSVSTSFSDTQNHWARLFIQSLHKLGIISGFPNGTFRPNNSITRAEFATLIVKAFTQIPFKREYIPFVDVPTSYWAAANIQKAYERGFLSGFPDRRFRPNDRMTRADVIVALVAGLDLASRIKPDLVAMLDKIYQDAATIPDYARNPVAIATRAEIVVNYPNTKLLNPRTAATRAEIAVSIYQVLLNLGRVEKISSIYIVVPPQSTTPQLVRVSHRREFRGAWVACVWNSDWPSQSGLPVVQQQSEMIALIEKLQALNFNALILQVRPEGDALYASQLEPWSAWLTGTQGQAPNPFYDPLELAISECHKRNIELHAWFNPYRAKTRITRGTNVRPHIAITNPESVYVWGNQLWMDPGVKVVQERAYNVILDVVRRYDVDGIHLDDYFYPYPIQGQSFPDSATYAAYQATGGRLSLGDWRRENVNQMVQRLWAGVKAIKPHVKFGISPFGIYRPGQPPGIRGLDAYDILYADAKKWLEQGWVDYIAPQLYWRIDQTQQSYPVLLQWWTQINPQGRHIYTGNNLGLLDGKAWKSEEIEKQVTISRSLAANLSLGNIFFSVSAIVENRQDIADRFQSSLYPQPVLVPTLAWQNAAPPAPPTQVQVSNRRISWQPGDNRKIRSWTLYQQNSKTWVLQKVLPAETTFVSVESGIYAVCAVDRWANESQGVMVMV